MGNKILSLFGMVLFIISLTINNSQSQNIIIRGIERRCYMKYNDIGINIEMIDKNKDKYNQKKNKKIVFVRSKSIIEKNDSIIIKKEFQKIIFKSNKTTINEDSFIVYKYLGYISALDREIISVSRWEDVYYLLINRNNSKLDTLLGLPLISPDEKYFITLYSWYGQDNFVTLYEQNKEEIFKICDFILKGDICLNCLTGYWTKNNVFVILVYNSLKNKNDYSLYKFIINDNEQK